MNEFYDIDDLVLTAMEVKGQTMRDGEAMCAQLIMRSSTEGIMICPWPYSTLDLAMMAAALQPLDVIECAFVSDVYSLMTEGKRGIVNTARGELARRFVDGDPDVTEALSILYCNRRGDATLVFVPYKVTDSVPVYDDPNRKDLDGATEVLGTVPDALRILVTP